MMRQLNRIKCKLFRQFKRITDVINLRKGGDMTDFEGTFASIQQGVRIRGANLWILFCGAVIASIGLDTNSPAIILGAMLISPLMTPILGVGLFIGINDRANLSRALKDFLAAVLVSLGTSALYFLITPFGEPTAEITARIRPTLLDVMVALFGGVAGIVSYTRKENTNAIPGVAIAIALMPPLCTAGFGLAQGYWLYLLGALYLFMINSVFITFATVLVVRLLGFPYQEPAASVVRKRALQGGVALAIIIVAPSAYLLQQVIERENQKQSVEQFIDDHLSNPGQEVINWEIIQNERQTDELKVYMLGEYVPDQRVALLSQQLDNYQLDNTFLNLVQTALPQKTKKEIADEATSQVVSKLATRKERITDLRKEVQDYFPEVKAISIMAGFDSTSIKRGVAPTIGVKWNRSGLLWSFKRNNVKDKLQNFLQQNLDADTVKVVEL